MGFLKCFHNDDLYLHLLHFATPSSAEKDLAYPARTICLELSFDVALNWTGTSKENNIFILTE